MEHVELEGDLDPNKGESRDYIQTICFGMLWNIMFLAKIHISSFVRSKELQLRMLNSYYIFVLCQDMGAYYLHMCTKLPVL